MKWFHHECAARHDTKLQVLGSTYGAEGIGIYWGLLEEIGQHSDTFHLKVTGISPEIDQKPINCPQILSGGIQAIPRLPLKLLAKNLFTSPNRLSKVIALCIELGLFDSDKWLNYNVLYSPSFEHRADDYTRRVQRKSTNIQTHSVQNFSPSVVEGTVKVRTTSEQSIGPSTVEGTVDVRTPYEHSSDAVRIMSDKVRLETDTEQKKNICNTQNVDNSLIDESYLIEPTESIFDDYCLKFHSSLQHWNRKHGEILYWNPSVSELKKLFYGGEYEHKLAMCFHAYKILGENINYPELVMRALNLLLKKSEKSKVNNPFGWLWACLHGNGNGKTAWVQLLTSDEERAP